MMNRGGFIEIELNVALFGELMVVLQEHTLVFEPRHVISNNVAF